jgi:hypothetical protein
MRSDLDPASGNESAAISQASFVFTIVPASSAGEMATGLTELYTAAFAAACRKARKAGSASSAPSWN